MNDKAQLLFVDDEAYILHAMERLLSDSSEVFTATTGEEGLELLKVHDGIGVVIADYRMRGMNGAEFLHTVSERRPDTVRILLSGYADLSAVVEAINKGHIYQFISKPWNDDELRMSISNAVERFRLCRQNALLRRQLQDANTKLLELNAILRERITDEVASLKKLNDDLMRKSEILDALPSAVVQVDQDGFINYYNMKMGELFSWREDAALYAKRGAVLGKELNEVIDLATHAGPAAARVRVNVKDFLARGKQNALAEDGVIILMLNECHDDEATNRT